MWITAVLCGSFSWLLSPSLASFLDIFVPVRSADTSLSLGYLVLILTHTPGQRYVGCFFAVMGVYAANGTFADYQIGPTLISRPYN
jgi:hypothetical protein